MELFDGLTLVRMGLLGIDFGRSIELSRANERTIRFFVH